MCNWPVHRRLTYCARPHHDNASYHLLDMRRQSINVRHHVSSIHALILQTHPKGPDSKRGESTRVTVNFQEADRTWFGWYVDPIEVLAGGGLAPALRGLYPTGSAAGYALEVVNLIAADCN